MAFDFRKFWAAFKLLNQHLLPHRNLKAPGSCTISKHICAKQLSHHDVCCQTWNICETLYHHHWKAVRVLQKIAPPIILLISAWNPPKIINLPLLGRCTQCQAVAVRTCWREIACLDGLSSSSLWESDPGISQSHSQGHCQCKSVIAADSVQSLGISRRLAVQFTWRVSLRC
jgi:hypothetical protein